MRPHEGAVEKTVVDHTAVRTEELDTHRLTQTLAPPCTYTHMASKFWDTWLRSAFNWKKIPPLQMGDVWIRDIYLGSPLL